MTVHLPLTMIVKKEAATLDRCFASVEDIVDEIIVVDTRSTDATEDIARQHAARVFDLSWPDSFAAARNESLRHANGQWLLWLDGDEYFEDANRDKLRPSAPTCPTITAPTSCSHQRAQRGRLVEQRQLRSGGTASADGQCPGRRHEQRLRPGRTVDRLQRCPGQLYQAGVQRTRLAHAVHRCLGRGHNVCLRPGGQPDGGDRSGRSHDHDRL